MVMLTGEYFAQIDQKGRVRIPAKLKRALKDGSMVTKGTNGCLFLFPQEVMQGLLQDKLQSVPLSDHAAAKSIRLLFSSAQEIEEDNQGRTLLPRNLREFAQVQKDIVFLGVGNHAEIWSKEVYEKYNEDVDFDDAIGELVKYGV